MLIADNKDWDTFQLPVLADVIASFNHRMQGEEGDINEIDLEKFNVYGIGESGVEYLKKEVRIADERDEEEWGDEDFMDIEGILGEGYAEESETPMLPAPSESESFPSPPSYSEYHGQRKEGPSQEQLENWNKYIRQREAEQQLLLGQEEIDEPNEEQEEVEEEATTTKAKKSPTSEDPGAGYWPDRPKMRAPRQRFSRKENSSLKKKSTSLEKNFLKYFNEK